MWKVIEVLYASDSYWAVASLCWMVLQLVMWKLAMREMRVGADKLVRGLLMFVYFLFFVIDKVLFVVAVRTQPSFDFGVYGSIIVPTILFYVFLFLTLVIGLRALTFGFCTPMSLLQFAPGMYGIALVQFMYAMGFSSPVGMFLGFVCFVTAGWKAISVPLESNVGKAKTD